MQFDDRALKALTKGLHQLTRINLSNNATLTTPAIDSLLAERHETLRYLYLAYVPELEESTLRIIVSGACCKWVSRTQAHSCPELRGLDISYNPKVLILQT